MEDILNKNACDVQMRCTDNIVKCIPHNYTHTHSINHLKLDKIDCVDGLSSDNLKTALIYLMSTFYYYSLVCSTNKN